MGKTYGHLLKSLSVGGVIVRRFDLNVSRQNNLDVVKYVLNPGDEYDDRVAEKVSGFSNVSPFQYIDMDGRRCIISYMHEGTTLAALMKETLGKKEVLSILYGVANAFGIGAQGVPVSYIIRDANYVYVNRETLDVKCILLPVKQDAMPLGEVPVFFRNIISNMMFDEKDTDNYVAKLLTNINSADFSIAKFKQQINQQLDIDVATQPMKPQVSQQPMRPQAPQQPIQPQVSQQPMRPQAPQQPPQPTEPPQQGSLMGQLGSVSKPVPHMIRRKTGEVIFINKSEFAIGKSKTKADYPLENNPAISRVHCIIVQKNGVNYIRDNHSTNHTFLNGVELEPGTEMLLKHKSVIQMGDEEFTFLLRKGD
jgi:hypothetical protein